MKDRIRYDIVRDISMAGEISCVHIMSFDGFFLSFLGKGFLTTLYKGFISHNSSDVIGAFDENNKLVGFLAYSEDISGFYKFLIKRYLLLFAWYSFIAFLKKPSIIFRLFRAFLYPSKSYADEKYFELSSIGVRPEYAGSGIGSGLISYLKSSVDIGNSYIKLETDAVNNDVANAFYKKNGFELIRTYKTPEGRAMNEYRYYRREKVLQ